MLDDEVLTPLEICRYLRISRTTLYRLCRRNQIPHFKIGTDYRFNREQIAEWIAERANLNRPISRGLGR